MSSSPNPSKRHHYLPQFYIKGFTNPNGFIWIYDKDKDEISSHTKPPKSVFFEWDLHTIIMNSRPSEHVEQFHKKLEDVSTRTFLKLRDSHNLNEIQNGEILQGLLCFINLIYWRCPANFEHTDALAEIYRLAGWDIFRDPIYASDKLSERDKSILLRITLPMEVIERGFTDPKFKSFGKIHLSPNVIIADNPVLFPKIPIANDNFVNELIFPISNERVYVGTKCSNPIFEVKQRTIINQLLIEQALRYVGCHDREILEKLVATYRSWKNHTHFAKEIREMLFKSIRGEIVL